MIKIGSDFSGVGAFNQALIRLGIEYDELFACDMDKYARQTFIDNYGEPKYFPKDVYEREIPKESLDIYMTSPPCQAFSLAGKRLGKEDKRGILFFNSYEFIKINKPRYFIFENVKGLLSDDRGNTFNEWLNLLGGKSVNGAPVIFPYDDAVPYHIYWKVLNAKNYGVPQNRERVFIIGIRDDKDNKFSFPMEIPLKKRLKDVLEDNVDEKYFLSEKLLSYFSEHKEIHKERGNGFKFEPHTDKTLICNAISTKCGTRQTDPYIKVKSATSKGYEIATEGDSINFSVPNSKTKRGKVGKKIGQTLDTACNQGVIYGNQRLNETIKKHRPFKNEILMIDSYNQSIHKDSICIRTTVNDSNMVHLWDGYQIRRLTPRECFRLMDFPDTFKWTVSDSQAYKQAGNSIVVGVLAAIIGKLKL